MKNKKMIVFIGVVWMIASALFSWLLFKGVPAKTQTIPVVVVATPPVIQKPVEQKVIPVTPTPAIRLDVTSSKIILLVNQIRANAGVAPLTELAHLDSGAYNRAVHLKQTGQWSHAGYIEALSNAIWSDPMKTGGSENLGQYQTTEEKVVNDWMNSPSHKKNILMARSRFAGVAHYKDYWVLWFTTNP